MLHARGLRPVRHFWHMQIDLAAGFQPGPTPAGIQIRGIDPRAHLGAVHAVLDEAFADHWGHHREPLDRWAQEQAGSPSYDPTLWLLATEEGEPVGALTASVAGDRGWVDQLGVLAPWRGRGIAAVRACGDARGEPVGLVGALVGRPAVAPTTPPKVKRFAAFRVFPPAWATSTRTRRSAAEGHSR
jgi:acetyltransferase (GNAT) family protein